jgi:uncharacterized membrane protein
MSERILRAGLFATAAFAIGYLLPGTLRLPIFFYDPVHRAVAFTPTEPSHWIRYYGDLLYAACASALAFCVAFQLRPRKTPLAIATGTALSLVALDVLFYLSRLLASV